MFETAVLSKGVPADGTNDVRKPPAGKISIVVSHSDPDLSPRGARMKGAAADTTLALDGLENIAASGSRYSATTRPHTPEHDIHSLRKAWPFPAIHR
jgi:hypothetical protein